MERLPEFIANHWYLFLALAALLAWMFASELSRLTSGVKQATASEAVRLRDKQDGLFVDTRSEKDYKSGHLPGAINVQTSAMTQKHKKLERYKQKPVIVYCQNGMTSGKSGKLLRSQGFEQVYQLKGGFAAWQGENLPTEK